MDHYEILDVGNRRLVDTRLVDLRAEIHGHSVRIVVQNIGGRVARDVRFQFPTEFKWPSRITDGKMPPALLNGIRFFPPDRRYTYDFCNTHQVFAKGTEIPTQFEVQVSYFPDGRVDRVSDTVVVDLNEYDGSMTEQSPLDRIARELDTGLDRIADRIHNPIRDMMKFAKRKPTFKQWRKKKD